MTEAAKPPIVRSPSYPSMSLREAVAAVRKIEAVYRGGDADREQAAKLIGYSGISGPSAKALAALANYGLVERAGKGELRVTARAIAILHGDAGERSRALRLAAVDPEIFQQLQDKWPGIIPPEDGVASFLRKASFNESAIRPAVVAYLDTLAYLEENPDTESHGQQPPSKRELSSPKHGDAQVGDLVQWEPQGVHQFEQPRRVRFVSNDGQWIAVEGSETGLPMSEVVVEQKATKLEPPKFPMATARETSGEGIEMILGPDTKAVIHVSGKMGPREISKLIRLLEAQKAVLEED